MESTLPLSLVTARTRSNREWRPLRTDPSNQSSELRRPSLLLPDARARWRALARRPSVIERLALEQKVCLDFRDYSLESRSTRAGTMWRLCTLRGDIRETGKLVQWEMPGTSRKPELAAGRRLRASRTLASGIPGFQMLCRVTISLLSLDVW